jgi:hypothetical protein
MTNAIENLASILYFFHFLYTPYYYNGTMYYIKKNSFFLGAPDFTPYSKHPLHLTTTPLDSSIYIY